MDHDQKHLVDAYDHVNFAGIAGAEVGPALTPFFCVDDILSADLLALCMDHWPAYDGFTPVLNTAGSFEVVIVSNDGFVPENINRTMNVAQARFWRAFASIIVRRIVDIATDKFAPFLLPKYGRNLADVQINTLALRCANESYLGLPMHVHYYYKPLWLFTLLFYLDDVEGVNRGLTLFRYSVDETPDRERLIDQIAAFASPRTDRADRLARLREDRTVDYRRNRLVMALDSPCSWHGVGPFEQGVPGWNRHHLVTHVALPRRAIANVYGVSPEDWTRIFTTDQSDRTFDAIRTDVATSLNRNAL